MATVPQRIADAQRFVEHSQRVNDFVRLAAALCATSTPAEAERVLRRLPNGDRLAQLLVERAGVPAGLTSDATWAAPLSQYQLSSAAFAESLRNISIFDRCLADNAFLRVPAQTKIAITSAGATAATIDEAGPKKASVMSFTTADLTMSKAVAFIVVSAELMRGMSQGAIAMLSRELRSALAVQTDLYLLSQLLSGISAIPSAGGVGALSVRQDLRVLMDAVSFGSNAKLYYVGPPTVVKRLAVLGDDNAGAKALPGTLPTGGTLDGLPLISSDAAAASTLTLFDAAQCVVASGDIELDRSDVAMLALDTTPDSPPLVTTNYQSLWQQNMSALRAERFLSVQRMRLAAVASISGITGIGDSPS
jgi:Phage capsid family